jgi:hypothetical protein
MRVCTSAALGLLALLCFAGCASTQWYVERRPPEVSALQKADSIAVARFSIAYEKNRRTLSRITDMHGFAPIEIPGAANYISILHMSPEPLEAGGLSNSAVAHAAQTRCVDLLSSRTPYDVMLERAGQQVRVRNTSFDGERLDAQYTRVAAVPETVDAQGASTETIRQISDREQVDVVLGGTIRLYAEVGEAVSEPSTVDGPKKRFRPGSFVLFVDVQCDAAAYDGETGEMIHDTEQEPYRPVFSATDRLFELPVPRGDYQALEAYIGTGEFHAMVTAFLHEACGAKLPLLVPHFRLSREHASL